MSAVWGVLPQLAALIVLLGLSAFFSGSETALFALSRARLKRMSGGHAADRAVAELLRRPQQLLSTVLVGNMVVNIMLASVIASLAGDRFEAGGVATAAGAIFVSTSLLLIFGELTPKTIAYKHAVALSRLASLPLLYISRVLTPVRVLLHWVNNGLLALLGQRREPGWGMLTQDEFSGMLAAGEAAGATDAMERRLVEQILNLGVVDARDIMVPRTEICGVSDELTVAAGFAEACRRRHSRLPVCHKDLDDIWGLICVADLPRWQGTPMMAMRLADLRPGNGHETPRAGATPVYPVHVVPETAKLENLLGAMQELRAQMVVIVDEYGGTAGILTLEDILEEVVGQISPSTDAEDKGFVVLDDGILVDGRTHLRDLTRELGLTFPKNGADTIGGYVMELLGRLPRAGDEVADTRYRFDVTKMAGRRIGALRVVLLTAADEGGAP